MTTRAQQKQIDFDHLQDVILELDDLQLPICLAFQRSKMTQVTDLLAMDDDRIMGFKYATKDDKGKTIVQSITEHCANRLVQFKRYVAFKAASGDPIRGNWTSIMVEDFEDFFTSMGSNSNNPTPLSPYTLPQT